MSSDFRAGRLRVLVVAHNAVAPSNRARMEALAAFQDLTLRLITPPWWDEEGRRMVAAKERAATREYNWDVARVAAGGNSTRYWYRDTLPRVVRTWHPDVVDVYEEPFSISSLQSTLVRNVLCPEAALVFYSAVNVRRRWRIPYRWTEKFVFRCADGAYMPSRDVGPALRERGFRGPIWTIPLGVDAQQFSPRLERAPHPALAGLRRPRIGFVGRLEPVKGVDILLQAAEKCADEMTFVIAGDGTERQKLQATMQRKGLGRSVHFLPPIPHSELPSFLASLDALVLPSVTLLPLHREQFGRVLVEAMASGTNVIGSDSGAIPEVIGDAGLIVPEGNPVALSQAIRRVTSDARLSESLRQRGRQRVARDYAWPSVAARTREMYRTVAARRRTRLLKGGV